MRYLILIISYFTLIQAVIGQRYVERLYPELDSIIGKEYAVSTNYLGNEQSLLFDFYAPKNDLETKRPLIIYIHGGGFALGYRNILSIKMFCRIMAEKGFAVASIDYRLDPMFNQYTADTNSRAMTDAMHDAKKAIRFFKTHATEYSIDTNLVFVGGESAGAITAMMAAYVDRQSEMDAYPKAFPNDPVGSTKNLHVSNKVAATLCLCGGIADTSAIENKEDQPPFLWRHGTEDKIIPKEFSIPVVLRAYQTGVTVDAKTYDGAIHCPWLIGSENWRGYLSTVIEDVTEFLYSLVNQKTVSKSKWDFDVDQVTVYPNPANQYFVIKVEKPYNYFEMIVTNTLGEEVLRKTLQVDEEHMFSTEAFEPGSYIVKVIRNNYIETHVLTVLKY